MSESDKSGKLELSAEDEKVIDTIINNHYAIHIAPTQLDIRLRHIAKAIMLHERSASQARIAELEAALEKIADYVDPHSPYNSGYIMKEIAKSVLKP